MKKVVTLLMFTCLLFAIQAEAQVAVYYQPTPYPLKKADGSSMSQDLNIVHSWDGWITNIYYGTTFQRDDKLQIGGWGDNYRTYLRFDLTGLPSSVNTAYFGLYAYPRGDSSTLVNFDMWRPTSDWPLSMTWSTQPGYSYLSSWSYGSNNAFWWLDGTSLYNSWRSGSISNYGITLMPWTQNNNFDVWRSSRYTTNDGQRPILYLYFTPTIQFKMPLPGNHTWLVTTEVGGYDCKGNFDQYHADSTGNYFSIDYSWRNVPDSGATTYTITSNIPVIAAAGGTANTFFSDPNDGNYVVVTHGSTGFTTRYLHLDSIAVSNGASVSQGTVLGYMGSTGISSGKHLHFGVRYNNSGLSSVSELAKVVMDGWILKSFQTECSVNGSGVPTDWIRYYRSGNTVY